MRFLCDEMLGRLCRWLRAAGHDAALAAAQAPDALLVEQARAEDRLLVTRDRDLAARAGEQGVLIGGEGPEAQAAELSSRLDLDWLEAPFTRCVMDNTPLRAATREEIASIPETAQGLSGPFRACPSCRRLYWPGSHVRRMTARLERFAEAGRHVHWRGPPGAAI